MYPEPCLLSVLFRVAIRNQVGQHHEADLLSPKSGHVVASHTRMFRTDAVHAIGTLSASCFRTLTPSHL